MRMIQDIDLRFEKGTVLTGEMLREVYDCPRDTLSILYDEYPDGILAGTGLIKENGQVYMKKGLIKYQGRIYRMAEDLNLTEYIAGRCEEGKSETKYRLLFVPAEPEVIDGRSSQVRHTLRLAAVPENDEAEGIEFARFKLPSSKKIELFHEMDVKDISGAKFWNMTQCPYACRGGTTFHPYIFQVLRPKLTGRPRERAWEYCVLEQLNTTGILSMELIRTVLEVQGVLPGKTDEMPEEQRRTVLLRELARLPEISRRTESGRSKPVRLSRTEGKMLP